MSWMENWLGDWAQSVVLKWGKVQLVINDQWHPSQIDTASVLFGVLINSLGDETLCLLSKVLNDYTLQGMVRYSGKQLFWKDLHKLGKWADIVLKAESYK